MKQEITLAIAPEYEDKISGKVAAYISDKGFIGIHRNVNMSGKAWALTHILTGMHIGSRDKLSEAKELAAYIEETLGEKLNFSKYTKKKLKEVFPLHLVEVIRHGRNYTKINGETVRYY